jgi:hypothetical protein
MSKRLPLIDLKAQYRSIKDEIDKCIFQFLFAFIAPALNVQGLSSFTPDYTISGVGAANEFQIELEHPP